MQREIKKIDKIFRWNGFTGGYVLSVFYYSSGDVATFSTIWNKPFPWQVIVTTQKKKIELKPLETCKSSSLNKQNRETHKIDIKDKTLNLVFTIRHLNSLVLKRKIV